jgi:hypothetical protein
MKTPWQIKDLIDLEYFLHIDSEDTHPGHHSDIEARDRDIFLKHIHPRLPQSSAFPRRFAIKSWLDRRREVKKNTAAADAVLPGEAYTETFRLLGYGLFILGGLSGIGLALALLSYTGTAPLNISVFLGATVFVQILLLLLLGGLLLVRMIRPHLFYSSVVYSVLSRLAIALYKRFKLRITSSLSGARRDSLAALLGLVRGKKQVYGSLFYWPVFILAQLFGIGFNLGVLGATLLRVLGTDMAFGWQSTVQVSATAVHTIVKWLAAPWAGFVPPELAHPTLSQIEGSRLVLKDGIYHLITPDLVAWWPFLCFAVLVYGLLPRLLLSGSGLLTQRHLLAKINFTQGICDQLVDRMTTPQVKFGDRSKTSVASGSNNKTAPISQKTDTRLENTGVEKQFIVLVPDDLFDVSEDKALQRVITQAMGGRITKIIRLEDADMEEVNMLSRLIPVGAENGWTHVLILQEAWQPPIVENLVFIKALRHHLGDQAPILVGLIGKPAPSTIFTPVTPTNWQTWKERLTTLGDPYLRLEKLVHGHV